MSDNTLTLEFVGRVFGPLVQRHFMKIRGQTITDLVTEAEYLEAS